MSRECNTVVFYKDSKGRRLAEPRVAKFCRSGAKPKSRRAPSGARCRAGGPGWRAQIKENFARGKTGGAALAPARYVACGVTLHGPRRPR